jgi:hypothetical protein
VVSSPDEKDGRATVARRVRASSVLDTSHGVPPAGCLVVAYSRLPLLTFLLRRSVTHDENSSYRGYAFFLKVSWGYRILPAGIRRRNPLRAR